MKNIIIFIKGFIFGTANIIPGVSGGTMAITLGIYEKLLNMFGHFFVDLKENISFAIPFILGLASAIIVMSNVISYALNNYQLATVLLFVGLIIGGMPPLLQKIKRSRFKSNYLYLVISFLIVIVFTLFGNVNNTVNLDLNIITLLSLLIVGIVASSAMVIPGISGSFVLMLIGYYKPIIDIIKDIFNSDNIFYNTSILLFLGIGIIIGIVLISRLIKHLLFKYETKTYYAIIGFVLASIISIFINVSSYQLFDFILGIPLFIVGIYISSKLGG
jgi:putative membrane protein